MILKLTVSEWGTIFLIGEPFGNTTMISNFIDNSSIRCPYLHSNIKISSVKDIRKFVRLNNEARELLNKLKQETGIKFGILKTGS